MVACRIGRFNTIPDAAWFLARKAREYQEYEHVLPAEMLFICQGVGGIRTVAARLIKQMLPYRKVQNCVGNVAAICQMSDLGVNASPRPCSFVLLSAPLRNRLVPLCVFLQNVLVKTAYISVCLDAHEDCDTLAFLLQADVSQVVGSLEPGIVYFRKGQKTWFCEWPDRPTWMVPRLLVKICDFLSVHHHKFFEGGVEYLRPLKLAEVATAIGCHLTSVSRVIAGVQAQTDWGRFPLKSLFSASVCTTGDPVSNVQVKVRIARIIESEDRLRPLSDEAIRGY